MRPLPQNSFRNGQPFRAEWQKPGITSVRLSQSEIDGVMGAGDPQDQLRRLYLQKTTRAAKS